MSNLDNRPTLPGVRVVDELLDAVAGADRIIAMATAMKARLLDTARRIHEDIRGARSSLVGREFRAESALVLRVSETTAGNLIEHARILVDELPATLTALGEAVLTPRHAAIVVEETRELDPDERAVLETRALKETHRSTGDYARTIRRWRERRTPETATARARKAFQGRNVFLDPGRDGMVWLTAHLPAVEGIAIDDRLDATARALHAIGDPRTLPQLRADLLCDVLLDRVTDATTRYQGLKPTVILTVPVTTLTGQSEVGGVLDGYGPLDAESTRLLASVASEFRRMLTDRHTAVPLSLGRERYRPSTDLRLWLRIRDRSCRFPGCTRRVTTCDIDHLCDWAENGCTDPANLAHLCRSHHMLKHETPFTVTPGTEEGVLEWTTPLGRQYQTRPPGTDPP